MEYSFTPESRDRQGLRNYLASGLTLNRQGFVLNFRGVYTFEKGHLLSAVKSAEQVKEDAKRMTKRPRPLTTASPTTLVYIVT